MHYFIGIDFGTSGARLAVIDSGGHLCDQVSSKFEDFKVENQGAQTGWDWPHTWQTALFS